MLQKCKYWEPMNKEKRKKKKRWRKQKAEDNNMYCNRLLKSNQKKNKSLKMPQV